ncbi:hypothetical protein [Nonomuraea sp. NPDC049709]|uniref:hypothetical protein n=1 Tax=Nonomuraea sp. NPDC049709 TaxID=3154736 RepID=UPI00341BE6EE
MLFPLPTAFPNDCRPVGEPVNEAAGFSGFIDLACEIIGPILLANVRTLEV